MIGALITAGVAGLGVAIIFLVAFLDIRDAERRCADARVEGQLYAGKLAIEEADTETQRRRADDEKARADAFDDEMASSHPDPAGARGRVLQRWAAARDAARASAGASPRAMPPAPAAAAALGTELLKPGE